MVWCCWIKKAHISLMVTCTVSLVHGELKNLISSFNYQILELVMAEKSMQYMFMKCEDVNMPLLLIQQQNSWQLYTGVIVND